MGAPLRPGIGDPARLSGREEVVRHVTWFLGAVENFRFFDLQVYPFADPEGAVAEVKAKGAHQADRAYLSSGLCSVPACCGRKDRVLARIF